MNALLRAALLLPTLLALPGVARAQTSGCAIPSMQCVLLQSWIPVTASATVAVSAASTIYTLPAAGPTLTLLVTNQTATPAFVALGGSSTVAVPGPPATPVPPYSSVWLSIGYSTALATITASGSAGLAVTVGSGGPLTVSGNVQLAPSLPLSYTNPAAVSVGVASGVLAAPGAYTRTLQVCTIPGSTTNVWLNPTGGVAVVRVGVLVPSGAARCVTFGSSELPLPTAAITAITDGGSSQSVTLTGG